MGSTGTSCKTEPEGFTRPGSSNGGIVTAKATPAWSITPRYLLVHTFAHALMRQLTLECGYSTAALRERLYVSEGDDGDGRSPDLYGHFRR